MKQQKSIRTRSYFLKKLTPICIFTFCLLSLLGCEKEDYGDVTFKPKKKDENALRTGLLAYIYRPTERSIHWGNPSMTHQEFFLGDEFTPMPKHEVWVDGHRHLTDSNGRIKVRSLTPGFHPLVTEILGTRFIALVPVEKARQSIVLLDLLHPDQAWWWIALPPHDYIIAPDVRCLAKESEGLRDFLHRYVTARARAREQDLMPLVSEEFRDEIGTRGDWLAAICAGSRRPRPIIRQVWTTLGNDEATLEWMGEGAFPGMKGERFQERLLLVREDTPPRWRIKGCWE